MSGIIVPVISMREFDYTFLAATATKTIVLHSALNVAMYYTARLIVRVHELTMSSGQKFTIAAYGTDPSREDPREFVLGSTTLSVDISSSLAAGSLVSDTDTDLYPFLKIVLTATQGSASATPLFAVLSADLLLREGT
jgi:hypothetical protein